jgi:type IV fimbrial biogenesis protein FimT
VKFSESATNPLINGQDELPNRTQNLQARPNLPHRNTRFERGMTLLEMLVALAVVGIVLTVVAPNVQKILSKNRTTAEINELSAVIQFARYTAIDQSGTAIVCPSTNFAGCGTDWNQPKIVFIDNNGNNTRDTTEPLLMTTTKIAGNNTMTGPNGVIAFYDSGAANGSASVKICPNSNDDKLARAININAQGRVRISIDSNDNDIFEDTDGNELSCG